MKMTIKRLLLTLFLTFSIFSPIHADDAALLPNAVQQFFDNNGNPLTSGYVYTYSPGTLNLKTTWKDAAKLTANANPIRLDAGGKAIIYGDGSYRQIVKDKNLNLIWDAVTAPGGGSITPTTVGDGNLVATILPWSGFVAPNQYVFAYGQEIARATYPELFTAITLRQNVNCTLGSPDLAVADTTQIAVGAAVEVSCVIAGTTVISKTGSTVTLSNNSLTTTATFAVFFPWGNGNGSTTFNTPDYRGRTLAGRDNMGGTAASRLTSTYFAAPGLGAFGGAQSKTLLTANLPAYTPTGTNSTPAITVTGGASGTILINAGGTTWQTGANGGIATFAAATAALNNAPVFTGTAQGGVSTPFSIVQPAIQVNYIIKITPDTSTSIATGVYSIGGMTGVIACGDGLLCTGNIISVTALDASSVLFTSFGSTTTITQAQKDSQIRNAQDYGVICDGTTVNSGLIGGSFYNAINVPFPINANGSITAPYGFILQLPPGVCITDTIDNRIEGLIIQGQGTPGLSTGHAGTEIRGNTAGGDVITLSVGGTQLRDVLVTSSIAAGSRTGAGIKITGEVQVNVERVTSNGHRYGFWMTGRGNKIINSIAQLNNNHGFFLDGSVTGVEGMELYFTQSNGNTIDGYHISGTGAGVVLIGVGAALNTSNGITVTGTINDVFISQPALSNNTTVNLDVSGNTGAVLIVTGGFYESAVTNINIGANQSLVSITGGSVTGGTTGILVNGQTVTISGAVFGGSSAANINLGATSARVTLSNLSNTVSVGANPVGLLINASAGPFMASSVNFAAAATQVSGTVPNGSCISSSLGLGDWICGQVYLNNSSGTNGQLIVGQTSATPLWKTASGDLTIAASGAFTFATVNANVGSFGSATQSPTYTVNAKGLITAAANVTITPAIGSVTGLGTGVATALGVNIGSAGAFVTFNGALGTPSSGNISNAILANMADSTVKGRAVGAGTGAPTDLTAAQTAAIVGSVGGALKSKLLAITRDLTVASGNVAYTGMGFTPSSCVAFGNVTDEFIYTSFSGMVDSSRVSATLSNYNGSTITQLASALVGFIDNAGTSLQSAAVASYDADGLTLAWTKTGTPTGTASIKLLCFR